MNGWSNCATMLVFCSSAASAAHIPYRVIVSAADSLGQQVLLAVDASDRTYTEVPLNENSRFLGLLSIDTGGSIYVLHEGYQFSESMDVEATALFRFDAALSEMERVVFPPGSDTFSILPTEMHVFADGKFLLGHELGIQELDVNLRTIDKVGNDVFDQSIAGRYWEQALGVQVDLHGSVISGTIGEGRDAPESILFRQRVGQSIEEFPTELNCSSQNLI